MRIDADAHSTNGGPIDESAHIVTFDDRTNLSPSPSKHYKAVLCCVNDERRPVIDFELSIN